MYQKYKNVETVKPGGLELKDRLVGVQRVTKVTKGGRAFGFSAIVVVGDEHHSRRSKLFVQVWPESEANSFVCAK